jgi:cobalt-precorrin-7 (C5)-methyltransferase
MKQVRVIGLGPGSPDYVTPAAIAALSECDLVFGGRRNLVVLDLLPGISAASIECYDLTGKLNEAKEYILSSLPHRQIAVVASGDPGFYGILRYLRQFLSVQQLLVIPGISSMQYMFAKIGLPWDDAHLGSLHGRDEDIAALAAQGRAAFLADGRGSIAAIAKKLSQAGYGNRTMYVGCDLSYPNELILSGSVEEFMHRTVESTLCVVVIDYE